MIYTVALNEMMQIFEMRVKHIIRVGSQGFAKEDKSLWSEQNYYCDGEVNTAFKVFMAGVNSGKYLQIQEAY